MDTTPWIQARCDATGRYGQCLLVTHKALLERIELRLMPEARHRYKHRCLHPREWLRFALRLGQHSPMLGADFYWPTGDHDDTELIAASLQRSQRFPTCGDMMRSPRLTVHVGIVWDGEDYTSRLDDGGVVTMREIVRRHDPRLIYSALDRVARRRRQVAEMQQYINKFVRTYIEHPAPAWVESRWKVAFENQLTTLVPLSLQVLGWSRTEELASAMLAQRAPHEIPDIFHGWRKLVRAAPPQRRQPLIDLFAARVPSSSIDLVAKLER